VRAFAQDLPGAQMPLVPQGARFLLESRLQTTAGLVRDLLTRTGRHPVLGARAGKGVSGPSPEPRRARGLGAAFDALCCPP